MQSQRSPIPITIERPIEFNRDPNTGLVEVKFVTEMFYKDTPFLMEMRYLLTLEVSQKLLETLPGLEILLQQISTGNTTPSA